MNNATSTTNTASNGVITRPDGTYQYTPITIYNSASGTYIPAGHYYNPASGAYFQVAPQTTTGTVSAGGSSVTPGAPNTGFGGDAAALWSSLLVSLAVIAVASVYIAKNAVSYR